MMKVYMQRVAKTSKLKILMCLSGDAYVGKTNALLALADALRGNSLYFYQQKGQFGSNDMRFVIRCNSKVIGIGTAGDDEATICSNIDFFESQNCNVGITATRERLIPAIKDMVDKTVVVGLDKEDVSTEYARGLVRATMVDLIVRYLGANMSIKKLADRLRQSRDFNVIA